MTATAELDVCLRVDIIFALPLAVATPPAQFSRARRAMIVAIALLLGVNALLALVLERGPAHLRDPEYGLRLTALRSKRAEHPRRKLAVVLGSSRTAMGIRPDVYETAVAEPDGAPLLFNMSMTGAGPILQLIALRRLLEDGIRPDTILLEFWPALMRGDGPYREDLRLNPERLRPSDGPLIDAFFSDPEETRSRMRTSRLLPLWYHRREFLVGQWPEAVPWKERADGAWAGLDEWGWLPGRISATPDQIARGWPHVAEFYEPLFRTYTVSPVADRALRELVTLAHERGIRVLPICLPESARFRSMMTPESICIAEEYREGLTAYVGHPGIDGRTWVGDAELPDGFHLTRNGAAIFSRKLATVLAEKGTE